MEYTFSSCLLPIDILMVTTLNIDLKSVIYTHPSGGAQAYTGPRCTEPIKGPQCVRMLFSHNSIQNNLNKAFFESFSF